LKLENGITGYRYSITHFQTNRDTWRKLCQYDGIVIHFSTHYASD